MKKTYFLTTLSLILMMGISSLSFGQKYTGLTAERVFEAQPFVKMFDGDETTRWESFPNNDLVSFVLDMGEVKNLSKIIIKWEAGGGKSYDLSFSTDNVTFSNVTEVRDNTALLHEVETLVSARYIKFQGVRRMMDWCMDCGYSAWEFEIYDNASQRITDVTGVTEKSRRPFELMFDGVIQENQSRWESFFGIDRLAFVVDLGAVKEIGKINIHWEGANANKYQLSYSSDNITYSAPVDYSFNVDGNRLDEISPATTARYIKLQTLERHLTCGDCGYSIWEFEVFDAANQRYTGLTADITSIDFRPLELMFDGIYDNNSRWESMGGTDKVSFIVDLGAVKNIDAIKIFWEAASSNKYTLSYSVDKIIFTNPEQKISDVQGNRTDEFAPNLDARYIKFDGQGRTLWECCGYSIWEFEVYGKTTGLKETKSNVAVNYNRTINTINFSENITTANLYNMSGMVVKSIKNVNEINIQNLPNGIYFVKFEDKSGVQDVFKVIR